MRQDPQRTAEAGTEDRVGTIIGEKFRLLRLIGRGGMGAVYEAENTWTKRRVATKVLRPEYAADRDALRRFMQEAQSASQIAHPNIIDVFDLGLESSDGSLYMVQELLSGTDLRRRLDDSPDGIPHAEAFELLVPILAALVSAHARGVVHRDLKPENIFLSRNASGALVPKLIDFGVSKVLSAIAEKGNQTGVGTAIGTPRYMSPEQIRGEASVDGRSDVWSMGVVLYELLSGKNPFEAPSSFLSVNRVLHDAVPRLDSIAPSVPPPVVELVHRALERELPQRWTSMEALLEAVFACPALDRGLRERHKGSQLYLAPPELQHGDAPTPAHFSLVTQLTPPTLPTMPVPAASVAQTDAAPSLPIAAPRPRLSERGGRSARWAMWIALTLAVGGGALLVRARVHVQPGPSEALLAPVAAVVAHPDAATAPSAAPMPTVVPKAAKRPAPPVHRREEGANQAPIVE